MLSHLDRATGGWTKTPASAAESQSAAPTCPRAWAWAVPRGILSS